MGPSLIKSAEVPKVVSCDSVRLSTKIDHVTIYLRAGIVNVKSRESLVMSAPDAATVAEDPFGAAPFRLPPGNQNLNSIPSTR